MIDLSQAAGYIAALTAADGWETSVTFQTFDEQKPARPGFARIRHGTLGRFAAKLHAWNEEGCGIFLMVNAGDGRGRTAQNVVQLRALFIDEDQAKKCPYQLAPSILVRTPRGEHAYWLLKDGAPLTRFTASQKQLAAFYGTDAAICDLPRVMRLPGFAHMKAAPVLVSLVDADAERRYALDDILAVHPVKPRRKRKLPVVLEDSFADMQQYIAWAAARPLHEGVRNTTAFAIAAEGCRRGMRASIIASVVTDYCYRAGIPSEAQAVIRSAERYKARGETP